MYLLFALHRVMAGTQEVERIDPLQMIHKVVCLVQVTRETPNDLQETLTQYGDLRDPDFFGTFQAYDPNDPTKTPSPTGCWWYIPLGPPKTTP
jgi:hypothetical protein